MSWLVITRSACHAALNTVLNTSTEKQVDTEAAEGQDKVPEICYVKVTFETCRLVCIHMEDTWKAAISEKPKE